MPIFTEGKDWRWKLNYEHKATEEKYLKLSGRPLSIPKTISKSYDRGFMLPHVMHLVIMKHL